MLGQARSQCEGWGLRLKRARRALAVSPYGSVPYRAPSWLTWYGVSCSSEAKKLAAGMSCVCRSCSSSTEQRGTMLLDTSRGVRPRPCGVWVRVKREKPCKASGNRGSVGACGVWVAGDKRQQDRSVVKASSVVIRCCKGVF